MVTYSRLQIAPVTFGVCEFPVKSFNDVSCIACVCMLLLSGLYSLYCIAYIAYVRVLLCTCVAMYMCIPM